VDFEFSEEQGDLRSLAAKVLGEHTDPARIKAVERADGIDRELWAALAQAGLLGVALPEAVGGAGFGIMEAALVCEQIGRYVAPVPYLATVVLGALPLAAAGARLDDVLPGVVAGDTVLTAALQEPGGRDPLRPATSIGAGTRLTGTKVAVPYAALADYMIVSATGGLYLLDPNVDGVTIEPARGTARLPQGRVVLDRAVAQRLDLDVASLYRWAIAGMCATAVGVCDRALRITADYISQREQFGKAIATFQGATMRAADAYIDTEALRITTWSAIWRLAEGRPADEALAIAKFWAADGGQRVVHAAQHLHGGMGVDTDYPIHRYFLWAKDLELALGGATAQLRRLGRSLADAAKTGG
jgi:3-oxocholest-4-en-26-oyl-CoA dehydrogenase beta subunit